jgi:hypothetical protein
VPIVQLTLDSLNRLDFGKANETFQRHLARAAVDCMDRPTDSKPRKVLLQIDLVPVMEQDGDCTEVAAQIQVVSKVPAHRTKVYSLGLRRNGALVFNEDSPTNIDQTTIFDSEEPGSRDDD